MARHSAVNRVRSIEGKNILVIGCGAGDDISSWLSFKPKSVIAIDYIDYEKDLLLDTLSFIYEK